MSENVEKMSENVQKLSRGAENTIFGHFLDNLCLFGQCFCLVTLSNARPLQLYSIYKEPVPDSVPERSRTSHNKHAHKFLQTGQAKIKKPSQGTNINQLSELPSYPSPKHESQHQYPLTRNYYENNSLRIIFLFEEFRMLKISG